jgi:carboxymethylenebutenolidase
VAEDHADGIITRREALRRLGLLGVTGATASSMLAAFAEQTAAGPPQRHGSKDGRVTAWAAVPAATITFPSPRTKPLIAAWAPAGRPKGGLLVIHENRGLTPHIQDVTRRMALEGFLALGPDFLTPSGGTPADENKGREMIGQLDRARTVANAVASLRFLKAHAGSNGRIGATGFCWGGGMTNALAVAAGPDLLAAAPYYGAQPSAADVSKIKARIVLHYASNDERINAGIPAYREALDKAGVTYQLYTYEGAQHAFNNDTSEARYNKAAADLAWSRTVAFLKKTLA